jgi:lipopolysaccharide biosynthesis regulator YciM
MDTLTFLSELIKSIAWPVTSIILVFLLRKPIIELVPLMKKLKYKELELEFSQEVMALKSETKEVSSSSSDGRKAYLASSKALELVQVSTRAAIIEAWVEVEAIALEVALSFWNQPVTEATRTLPNLGEYLHKCKVIDSKELGVFQRLRQLRNKAAHSEELNLGEKDARSYVILAANLAEHIRNA